MSDPQVTLNEIWSGDLFDRRSEAQVLAAFIESIADRPIIREDKQAYTLAVDAGYGEGKTFFLRRLASSMSLNHPVAFVDAWADDLADEPLTALAATLKDALGILKPNGAVGEHLVTFMQKAGKVAKIAGVGLLRRGASLAITATAVEAVEEVLTGFSEETRNVIAEDVRDGNDEVIRQATSSLSDVPSEALMEKRIIEFEQGKRAVVEMKQALADLVKALGGDEPRHAPIVIIIDELDRCRPTYAIKLLEEIKHLFDVQGIVFVLGINREQLGYSIKGAYGSGFDGHAYLRRFMDREYRLAEPKLLPLLVQLCDAANLTINRLQYPPIGRAYMGSGEQMSLPQVLEIYMSHYGLAARDAFELVDILQTADAIVKRANAAIVISYFVPLIIGYMKGLAPGELPKKAKDSDWRIYWRSGMGSSAHVMTLDEAAEDCKRAVGMDQTELAEANNGADRTIGVVTVSSTTSWDMREQPSWSMKSYPRLLQLVGRFSNPKIDR